MSRQELGNAIRKIRGSMTQAELSKLSGVSQSTISEIESGKTISRFDVIALLTKALGISMDQLVDEINQVNEDIEIYLIDKNIQQAAWIMKEIPEQYREYAVTMLEGILKIIKDKE